MMLLIMDLVPKMAHYFARRIPQELGKFHWIVDAKDEKLTEFEKAWSLALFPIMGTASLKEPIARIEGGDYSYLDRYLVKNKDDVEYLKEFAESKNAELVGKKWSVMTLSKLLGESFKFADSKTNTGLQIADVIANAIQRALNNKLQPNGWSEIGGLMINKEPYPLDLVSFNTGTEKAGKRTVITPFYGVFQTLRQTSKSIWTKEDQDSMS